MKLLESTLCLSLQTYRNYSLRCLKLIKIKRKYKKVIPSPNYNKDVLQLTNPRLQRIEQDIASGSLQKKPKIDSLYRCYGRIELVKTYLDFSSVQLTLQPWVRQPFLLLISNKINAKNFHDCFEKSRIQDTFFSANIEGQ